MSSYSTVLVGTDGSPTSFKAVGRAAEIAQGMKATLLIVTAYRALAGKELKAAVEQLGSEAYKVTGSSPAEAVLEGAKEVAVKAGAKKVETLAVEGDAVDVLADTAAARKIDLLVVGNRGLNSLAGRLLGSVPQNISHRSPCDILIVHTTGK